MQVQMVNCGLKAALLALNVGQFCEEVRKLDTSKEGAFLDVASMVNKFLMLAFRLAEVGAVVGGAKAETMRSFKAAEAIPQALDIPIELTKQTLIWNEDPTAENALRIFEKGLLGPISNLISTTAEREAYTEKWYIEMSPEERAKHKRIVYEYVPSGDGITLQPVGSEPIDVEDCKQRLCYNETVATSAAVVKISSDTETLTTTYRLCVSGFAELSLFFACLREHIIAYIVERNRFLGVTIDENKLKVEDLINLRILDFIPHSLRNDVVLKRLVCPITGNPIRYPVGDPDGVTIYERHAIISWICEHGTSKVTNKPLCCNDLIEKPTEQLFIDNRLECYEKMMIQFLESSPELRKHFIELSIPGMLKAMNLEKEGE